MSYTTHPYIYKMLKMSGHDPAKSAEIMLDAGRGDRHARQWIISIFRGRRS